MPFVRGLTALHRLLPLLILSAGCNKLFAKDTPAPSAEKTAEGAGQAATAGNGEPTGADRLEAAKPAASEGQAARYGVPFAWEASPDEPLARARKFMGEVLSANAAFMAQGRDHFLPFAEGEKPRATVLACSDSRVQAGAWDGSPENDDYTVRNLGNQLGTSLGSVSYGVEQLHTPVLLIVGHTGCDAVKTVMNKAVKPKDGTGEELSRMKLGERRRGGDSAEWDALTAAVVANVDAQVSDAVAHFSSYVQSGELTVVGAVYDVVNDFDDGHGRLRVVNVNSNVEDERIDAFVEAVKESVKPAAPALAAPRTPQERGRALLDGTNRLQPGTPRATVNAVNVLGNGGFDPLGEGAVRAPSYRSGGLVPGTVDLRLAPGSGRYANVGRGAPLASGHADAEHGPAATEHGAAPAPWRPSTAKARPAAPADASHGKEATPERPAEPPPAEAAPGPKDHDSESHDAPAKGGLAIPGAAHDATPPARRRPAEKPPTAEKSEAHH